MILSNKRFIEFSDLRQVIYSTHNIPFLEFFEFENPRQYFYIVNEWCSTSMFNAIHIIYINAI